MIDVSVCGVGLIGPGLSDWVQAAPLLCDPTQWQPVATVVPAPTRMPATERRRAGTVVKASIVVADQALAAAPGIDAATLATVFSSSTGDPFNCHVLCEALALPERLVSPTRFTNSVHNAPAGYWHIATASRAPSTSLAAFDASFAAGLLEAAAQCASLQRPVLLVACDVPYPHPMHIVRTIPDVFAVALLLAPAGGRALRLATIAPAPSTDCAEPRLEALRAAIPAAHALPLLQALAGNGSARIVIDDPSAPTLALDLAAR